MATERIIQCISMLCKRIFVIFYIGEFLYYCIYVLYINYKHFLKFVLVYQYFKALYTMLTLAEPIFDISTHQNEHSSVKIQIVACKIKNKLYFMREKRHTF